MKKQDKIAGGLYLVIDPGKDEAELLGTLEQALKARPCAVQIWDNFAEHSAVPALIGRIKVLCNAASVPLLINNHPEWVELFDLDGVHFDEVNQLSESCLRAFKGMGKTVGLTTNNDFEAIKAAVYSGIDYLSFCSMFPSGTSNSCELVDFDTVIKTREITSIPIFLAGGINPENLAQLGSLKFDGIAVVSGVMSAEDPQAAILKYQQALSILKS
ncbi:thiamine phosphate synthase [Algoriphagus halophytocola]|uniref:Thiamine phosphate synthase n=1 Tax=Algoriphagus halophytocola TaxID=2991499 RepID=A0ABY6MFE3_9BACT|nr:MULTISPECIES: thiamine phosphate synthase [unclassified Algoriphagus]UZD21655.1 thiamine phosphate synthase [Algoriphagus sp. TR-M5]WBL42867.1 thiamine phosphate synthase [Algoriphagus sp. TR-M9]